MAYEFGVGEYVTTDGSRAKVLGEISGWLVGYFLNGCNEPVAMRWRRDGKTTACSELSLLPPKQTRTYWINVYRKRHESIMHESESSARSGRDQGDGTIAPDCLACVPVTIEFTPGEGLTEE